MKRTYEGFQTALARFEGRGASTVRRVVVVPERLVFENTAAGKDANVIRVAWSGHERIVYDMVDIQPVRR